MSKIQAGKAASIECLEIWRTVDEGISGDVSW